MNSILNLFDKLDSYWHGRRSAKLTSNILIIGFLLGLVVATLSFFNILEFDTSFFISIDIAFSILLFFEVLGLIFLLPRSVADSLGKQFEIFSIILLRSAFKEFGEFDRALTMQELTNPDFYIMLVDAFGALLIFLIIGFYYNIQKHTRITDSEMEQQNFIRFKKFLAIGILLVFILIGVYDLYVIYLEGFFAPSFHTFYMFLIFNDILILLFSLRYTSRYYNIFRYSSFAFATVLLRFALSAEPITNVVVGLSAGLFVLGLSFAYNYFIENREADT